MEKKKGSRKKTKRKCWKVMAILFMIATTYVSPNEREGSSIKIPFRLVSLPFRKKEDYHE